MFSNDFAHQRERPGGHRDPALLKVGEATQAGLWDVRDVKQTNSLPLTGFFL